MHSLKCQFSESNGTHYIKTNTHRRLGDSHTILSSKSIRDQFNWIKMAISIRQVKSHTVHSFIEVQDRYSNKIMSKNLSSSTNSVPLLVNSADAFDMHLVLCIFNYEKIQVNVYRFLYWTLLLYCTSTCIYLDIEIVVFSFNHKIKANTSSKKCSLKILIFVDIFTQYQF